MRSPYYSFRPARHALQDKALYVANDEKLEYTNKIDAYNNPQAGEACDDLTSISPR